jgi:hypothetical protein
VSEALPLTAERVEQWRAVQPPGWRGRLVPAGLWVAVVVLATALSPEGGCSAAAPCGPDWVGATEFVAAVSAPVLLLWWPPLGALVSLVAAALFAGVELHLDELPLWLAVGLPVAAAVATVEAEARRRARAAAAARLAQPVPVGTVPSPPVGPALRSWRWLAGAACLAVAPFLLGYGVWHGRSEAALERRAAHVTGTVVAHGDDGYLVTVALADRRHEFDTYDADDYPVGSEQEVLALPDGRVRLSAERYDPSWYLAVALGLVLLGGTLLGRAERQRRALQALLTSPQPVHAVRLAASWDGGQVLPVDGEAAPLLELDLVPLPDDSPWDAEDDEEQEGHRLVPATLYGLPVPGAPLAAVLDDGLRLVPAGPAKPGDPAWREAWLEVETDAPEGVDALALDPDGPTATAAEVAQWRTELLREEWWRAPAGAVLVLVAVGAAFFVGRESEGVFTTLWRCAIAGSFAFDGLVRVVSRVHLTPAGLVHDGPTTRRTVPWRALEGLVVADGDIVLARTGDEVLPLTWLPHRPWRKERRRAWARRWAAVLAAEARAAAPGESAAVRTEPRLHAAVVAVAFTAAVLLGLWSRGAL